jgi:ribonucleoside-triphosphate reductase
MNEVVCPKCAAKTEISKTPGKGAELVSCPSCKHEFKVAKCRCCGSANVYGISRVVGYYSKINNWNKSKTAEFRDRQKGDYKL